MDTRRVLLSNNILDPPCFFCPGYPTNHELVIAGLSAMASSGSHQETDLHLHYLFFQTCTLSKIIKHCDSWYYYNS